MQWHHHCEAGYVQTPFLILDLALYISRLGVISCDVELL